MTAPTDNCVELAMRVANLRAALETANRVLSDNGHQLLVGCNETQGPTFRGGRKFWAEVQALADGRAR